VNSNLKLYGAVMGKHVPRSAHEALGMNPDLARALVVAGHKGGAMREAEYAGIKVNLNGWRLATPPRRNDFCWDDVDALQRTKLLFAPKPGEVLLSRSTATGFVARFSHAVQRWTRVAEFVDGQAVLLPGAVDEMRWDGDGKQWQIDAQAWRARIYYGGEHYGEWMDLDTITHCHHFPRRVP
jgi:hypothetical protein